MKRIIEVTLTVLAVLGLSGSSAQKQSLDGVWRSEGYGLVFDIQGATLKSFEVTATTCMPGDRPSVRRPALMAAKSHSRPQTRTCSLSAAVARPITGSFTTLGPPLTCASTASRICRRSAIIDAEHARGNFEVFARTWSENYILFDQQRADWDAIITANRAKITDKTTPAELSTFLRE